MGYLPDIIVDYDEEGLDIWQPSPPYGVLTLGTVKNKELKELLDQNKFGLYIRKGCKIPKKYKKEYKRYKKLRRYCIFNCKYGFKKNTSIRTLISDIILVIKLLKKG